MPERDFKGLARELLGRSESLVSQWLPGGKKAGNEYTAAETRHGGRGNSLSVNLNTGSWKHFATGDAGGDLISLFAYLEGCKNSVAYDTLSKDVNFTVSSAYTPPPPKPDPTPEVGAPPSEEMLNYGFAHRKMGKPVKHWVYRDEAGAPLMVVARYDTVDEETKEKGKAVLPWVWDMRQSRWTSRHWGYPSTKQLRPLYGLQKLVEMPDVQALIVEGEWKADCAQEIVGNRMVVLAWSGGAASIRRADWGPLRGRSVVLWPDADRKPDRQYWEQPGPKAMQDIAGILAAQGNTVKVLDVGIDEKRLDGWDAKDAVSDGWNWERFSAWAKPRLHVWPWDAGKASVTSSEPQEAAPPLPPEPPSSHKAEQVPMPPDQEIIPPRLEPDPEASNFPASMIQTWERLELSCLKNGNPHINLDNVYRFLSNEKTFTNYLWYDEFHEQVFTQFDPLTHQEMPRPRPWTDNDDLILLNYLQRHVGLTKMTLLTVTQGVALYAQQHVRNEPKAWLSQLRWDGTRRMGDLLHSGFGAKDDIYSRMLSRNWMVSLVARILRPGCQVDTMPVLCGVQGIKKSTSLDALGSPWFAELSQKIDSLEFFRALRGKIMVEISEMAAFRKSQIEEIKKMLTTKQDHYRAMWGRHTEAHPRRTVFVGTTNSSNFLGDETGARRFWPIRCFGADPQWIRANREQLFAEAQEQYYKWESSRADQDGWWVMPEEETRERQEAFRDADEWENPIEDWLENEEIVISETTISEVADKCLRLPIGKVDRIVQLRIGKCLRILGWECHGTTRDRKRVILWTRAKKEERKEEANGF